MEPDVIDASNRLVRSPALDLSRPSNIRHLSEDLQSYIDLYGISGQTPEQLDGASNLSQDFQTTHKSSTESNDFLFSGNVDQELKNLQNLKRLSLDVLNLDPDLPTQNLELKPTLHAQEDQIDGGNSLYWVPARIHPEVAPQEWQSFVQKRTELGEYDDSALAAFRAPSLKRGLSRSRSLLSREVSSKNTDQYRDAGPELERRRSKLRGTIKVSDLENVKLGTDETDTLTKQENDIPEEGSLNTTGDEPILVPPPGQILRRAARTGKGKGSYRRFAKPKLASSSAELQDQEQTESAAAFGSETIHLRADAQGMNETNSPVTLFSSQAISEPPLERVKSRNRTIQVVGPKSPVEMPAMDLSDFNTTARDAQAENIREEHVDTMPGNSILPADRVSVTVEPSTSNVPLVAAKAALVPSPTQDDRQNGAHARPGIKRELSAASLTRAVMSGTAPSPAAPTSQTPARRQNQPETTVSAPNAISAPSTKKSAWGKLFSTEDKSKNKKDVKSSSKMKRSPSQEERGSYEKDAPASGTNLFSNIFGAKKKEKDITAEAPRRSSHASTKSLTQQEPRFFSRYPIQLERAIYRMAHLKLGNSRRPLFHQVLLSNFMYGYLALVGANTSGQASGPGRKGRQHNGAQRPSTGESREGSSPPHAASEQQRELATAIPPATMQNGTKTSSNAAPPGHEEASPIPQLAESARHRPDSGARTPGELTPVSRPGPRPQRPGPVRRAGSMDVHEIHQVVSRPDSSNLRI